MPTAAVDVTLSNKHVGSNNMQTRQSSLHPIRSVALRLLTATSLTPTRRSWRLRATFFVLWFFLALGRLDVKEILGRVLFWFPRTLLLLSSLLLFYYTRLFYYTTIILKSNTWLTATAVPVRFVANSKHEDGSTKY